MIIFTATNAFARIDSEKAIEFTKKVTDLGIKTIDNKELSKDDRNKIFTKIFNDYFDLQYISKFVLGRSWKKSSNKEQQEFMDTYKEQNILSWSKKFEDYEGYVFDFDGTKDAKSNTQIFVNTTVNKPACDIEPVTIVWRLRYKNGEFKIIDLVIEGVSLALTTRNEYATFIKNADNGVADLIVELKQNVKDLKTKK